MTYIKFIECSSLSISYDIFGIATVSYTLVSNENKAQYCRVINAGGRRFEGYITSIDFNPIQGTENWYESHVVLIATTVI